MVKISKIIRSFNLLLISVCLVLAPVLALPLPVSAFTMATFNDDYPHKNVGNTAPGTADPANFMWTTNGSDWDSDLGFAYRNCTDFVAYKLFNSDIRFHGLKFKNDWDNGQRGLGSFGHAKTWDDYARTLGFTVSDSPSVGAVAQWDSGGGGHGHVAIVTKVNTNGSVDIVEYNFESTSNGFQRGKFGHREGVTAESYIHFERPLPGGMWKDDTPASGVISGAKTIAATVQDNGNGGLDKAQITVSEFDGSSWTSWTPKKTQSYSGGPAGEISFNYSIPSGKICARVSFDVFSLNNKNQGAASQARQLAPMGVRQYKASGSANCGDFIAADFFNDAVDIGMGGSDAGGSSGGSSGCSPGQYQAAVFTDANYGGNCVVKDVGTYNDPSAIGLSNDSITSLKIGSGAQLTLCDNAGINSPCEWFTQDDPDLANNTINTNTVSSLRVEGNQPTNGCSPSDTQVSFFEHQDWGGLCITKNFGVYNDPGAIGLPNDSISSIKVGARAKVRVCNNAGMNSPCEEFDQSDSNLNNNSINTDTISAAEVYLKGGIRLCDGTNQGGECKYFGTGNYNMQDYGFNDRAESVGYDSEWAGLYHIVLYTDQNQSGYLYHADNNVGDLGSPYNNNISSVQIYKHNPPGASLGAPNDSTVLPNGTTSVTLNFDGGDSRRVHVWGNGVDRSLDWTNAKTWQLDNLTPGAYFWQVQARGVAGEGAWTEVRSFGINTAPVVVGGEITMDGGATQVLQVQSFDAESGAVTLAASGLPSWATFVDNGSGAGTLTLSPGSAVVGIFPITISASDGTSIGNGTVNVSVVGEPSATYQAQYYNNKTLSGVPVLTRDEPSINYSWGSGSPDSSVSVDNFSARWSRVVTLNEGMYTFAATGDDGLRLYVDGQLVIDKWIDQGPSRYYFDKQMSQGNHFIVYEYYENGGGATASLDYYATDLSTQYSAEYFNNTSLSGTPVLTRTDHKLDYWWGSAAPADGVNSDNFSVRWTRTANFEAGTYNFSANGDDGMRLYVDGQLSINGWDNPGTTNHGTSSVQLTPGQHTLVFEYYENGGWASTKLSYTFTPPPLEVTDYQAAYFNNTTLSGTPVLTRTEERVDYWWGGGSPDPVVSSDNFSARWIKAEHFDEGIYTFEATGDDGLRLYIDGQLVVDKWIDQGPSRYYLDRQMAEGNHSIVYEYYENGGGATALLSYHKRDSSQPYTAEFFNNTTLSGTPALTRTDYTLDYWWGSASPASGVNGDNFSIRWTGTVNVEAGVYKFSTWADDGSRLYIDGELVMDGWAQGPASNYTNKYLASGEHTIKYEYFEIGGWASAYVGYELIEPEAPSTGPYTAQYFNNGNLDGSPVLTRQEENVGDWWGYDSPHQLVNSDNFSARWSWSREFSQGLYGFSTWGDDGVRLYIDGNLVLDRWVYDEDASGVVYIPLTSGMHDIVYEYNEAGGYAYAGMSDWYQSSSIDPYETEYFNNTDLSGSPALTRDEYVIDHWWDGESPGVQVSADNFSARWQKTEEFAEGDYEFYAWGDDGVRVYIDDQLVIDAWEDQPEGAEHYFVQHMTAGAHTFKVEYYQSGGVGSGIDFGFWEYYPEPTYTAEFFDNQDLEGEPVLVEEYEGDIEVWWDDSYGPGEGQLTDHFSARYTQTREFEEGLYRFELEADDGVRLYVDGELLIDKWYNQSGEDHKAMKQLSEGDHTIVVEHYNDTGEAWVYLDEDLLYNVLDEEWNLQGDSGASEAYQDVDDYLLDEATYLVVTYNLHGLNALGGDASALIIDQGGWKYVSLSNYGQNGLDGEQTVVIPISDFEGLDTDYDIDGTIHTRFWYDSAFTVDITSIKVF